MTEDLHAGCSRVQIVWVRFDGRPDQQVSGFQSERPVGIVSGEMVVDRLSIPSILPTWWFLPCRNGCTDSVAEIRFEDPFSSGINVTGRCSWRWKFRPVASWTFVYFKRGITWPWRSGLHHAVRSFALRIWPKRIGWKRQRILNLPQDKIHHFDACKPAIYFHFIVKINRANILVCILKSWNMPRVFSVWIFTESILGEKFGKRSIVLTRREDGPFFPENSTLWLIVSFSVFLKRKLRR